MKKEIFEIVLSLSKQTGDVSWEIEKFMEILLKDTDADLNQLHEDLMLFVKILTNCDTDNQRYNVCRTRYVYLEQIYGIYFEE